MIGPEAGEAVPALIRTLGSDESALRATAALALSGLGTDAKAAISPLQQALQDQNEDVRRQAKEAVLKIDPHNLSTKP
jgi:HEAT repeat protein